jgi:hypothetical protein
MNFQIPKLAEALLQANSLNKKFLKLNLQNKIANARSKFPEDKTLAMIDRILDEKNDLFVTSAELTNWYHKFHTPSTKTAEILKDELNIVEKKSEKKDIKPVKYASYDEVMETASHPILSNALSSLFNGEEKIAKSFDPTTGQLAEKLCNRELNNFNTPASKIKAFTGNSELIICLASFETPKGETHLAFPIETPKNKPIFASVFLTEIGPIEANAKNITQYLQKNAGKQQKINYGQILKAAEKKELKFKEISDVEKAALNLILAKQDLKTKETIKTASLNISKYQEPTYLNLPKPSEEISFSNFMESKRGKAEFVLGKEVVKQADTMIDSCLKYANIIGHQLGILSHTDNSITYGVTVNKSEFKIPVKINKKQAQIPSIIIANGGVQDFTIDNLIKAANTKSESKQIWATLHPDDSFSNAQLVDLVKEASIHKNISKAEETLQVLATREDNESYNEALKFHLKALTSHVEPEKSKCSMQIKSASTTQKICGHTHLPLNKVFQDQFGQCVPIYRKSIVQDDMLPLILKAKLNL